VPKLREPHGAPICIFIMYAKHYLSRNAELCLPFRSINLTFYNSSIIVFIIEYLLNQDQASELSNQSRYMALDIKNVKRQVSEVILDI
jgi:hypothetical protein